jgi:hypothetical protein
LPHTTEHITLVDSQSHCIASELNFQLIGLFPAVLVVGGVCYQTYSIVTRNKKLSAAHASIRRTIRDIERFLNTSNLPTAPVIPLADLFDAEGALDLSKVAEHTRMLKTALYETGKLVVLLNSLHQYGIRLPHSQRSMFLEDLSDLHSEHLSVCC